MAGAQVIVGLCARTSTRNRLNSIVAIAVAFVLFTPWLLAILAHLSEINASMHGTVTSSPSRIQMLLGALRFLRLDNVDFNGAHWLWSRPRPFRSCCCSSMQFIKCAGSGAG